MLNAPHASSRTLRGSRLGREGLKAGGLQVHATTRFVSNRRNPVAGPDLTILAVVLRNLDEVVDWESEPPV
jgi:hypothetical protein